MKAFHQGMLAKVEEATEAAAARQRLHRTRADDGGCDGEHWAAGLKLNPGAPNST